MIHRADFSIRVAAAVASLWLLLAICDPVSALAQSTTAAAATAPTSPPAFWALAPTPPMGWNSYDCFGGSVTQDEVLANASYIKTNLLSHGWKYVVVDFRWYDPEAAKHEDKSVAGSPLEMDQYGRLLPVVKRFPSAAGGAGFKGLADQIHAIGLQFGIHAMRGIPRNAVAANYPIEGSNFHAADAADRSSLCGWSPDMFGVDATKPAGRAYYDSVFQLYASWGVDFVKVDDLSAPYHTAEIEAIRASLDKCGRPIVFSTSPGATPVKQADHISQHANMWRISGDFWDEWKSLNHNFDLLNNWRGVGGPGHWPDADMLPLGRVGIRSVGVSRMTRFTHDEQQTMMSLWALNASPLMVGGNLPDNDAFTTSLLTNDGVLAIDQDPLGSPAIRIAKKGAVEIWARDLANGDKAVGIFNRGNTPAAATIPSKELKIEGPFSMRDVWTDQRLGNSTEPISRTLPPHGSVLVRLVRAN
jgi:alpha-galactosidase